MTSDPERPAARDLRIRRAVRAVIVTPEASILLCRFEFGPRTVWALPGGGIDPGESHVEALHRELDEELGLTAASIGPQIWSRRHIIPFIDGRWDGQDDVFHLVPVPDRFEPAPRLTWDELRAERLHEFRWWEIDELDRGTASGTTFAPARLAELVRSLHRYGPPGEVVDAGV